MLSKEALVPVPIWVVQVPAPAPLYRVRVTVSAEAEPVTRGAALLDGLAGLRASPVGSAGPALSWTKSAAPTQALRLPAASMAFRETWVVALAPTVAEMPAPSKVAFVPEAISVVQVPSAAPL